MLLYLATAVAYAWYVWSLGRAAWRTEWATGHGAEVARATRRMTLAVAPRPGAGPDGRSAPRRPAQRKPGAIRA